MHQRAVPPPTHLRDQQKLIDKLDGDLAYALRTDGKMAPEDCENYEEVGAWGRTACWYCGCARCVPAAVPPLLPVAPTLHTHACCCVPAAAAAAAEGAYPPSFTPTHPPTHALPALQVRDEIKGMLEKLRDTPVR